LTLVSFKWDTQTPKSEQITDLYSIIDKEKICMFNTYRNGTGPVGRAMALASRRGPDLLFLANSHSEKFSDIEKNKEVQVTFSDSTSVGWVSVTGEAVTARNDDPRIKELWSKGVSAWFGDLGDGVHTGGPEDPRMALIEVKSKYVSYWKKTTGTLGFFKEVGQAALTGEVAQTGLNRRLEGGELEKERGQ
jgi:general stress protein 26